MTSGPKRAATDLSAIAEAVADKLLGHAWKLWFWGDSIGIEGLLAATELTRDDKYFGYVYGLLKAWVARELSGNRFDYTVAGTALLATYQRTRDPRLLESALRHADYLSSFRRTACGAYIRDEGCAADFPPDLPAELPEKAEFERRAAQIPDRGPFVFVDSMHSDGPFFSKLYETTGEPGYIDLALDNIVPQTKLLFDPKVGLFHHYWSESTQRRNGVLWARGNGWGLLGLVCTLKQLPSDHPRCERLRDIIQRVSARVMERMDVCGGWHTVLDDPTSYIETSAGAFFIDAISTSVLHGWLVWDRVEETVRRALDFLLSRVGQDGTVEGVSHDTFPSTQPDDYTSLPRGAAVPWGQGPFLTALLSYSKVIDLIS
jgi:unsaturated rhamnogalacturonyl hydrolase